MVGPVRVLIWIFVGCAPQNIYARSGLKFAVDSSSFHGPLLDSSSIYSGRTRESFTAARSLRSSSTYMEMVAGTAETYKKTRLQSLEPRSIFRR